jgi:uncharacterized membrane protein YfcA
MYSDLEPWHWLLLALGAFVTGLSKTGIAGLGVLSVALFANALPPRASTGALLPLLIAADIFGVAFFRKHASWGHLARLFPWVIPGVVLGYVALGRVSDFWIERLIGGILVVMVVVHVWRQQRAAAAVAAASVSAGESNASVDPTPHTLWFAATMGILAGFTTMVANAAGPIMILYLLSLGLPKLVFVGTGAWFFMLINIFKVPFSLNLGLINLDSLILDALLVLPMVPGALLGPIILKRMNQKVFETVALILTVLAAARLVW